MSIFEVQTIDEAPEGSKAPLRKLQQAFGVAPNVAGVIANSPVLANIFVPVFQGVHSGTFSEAEIQTLLLTNAVTNASEWAVAFHTALALKQGIHPADVDAIRRGVPPDDPGLAALSMLARALIEKRGRLAISDQNRFFEAGYSSEQILEVIAVVAASTITNYTGSVTQPALEAPFEEFVWHVPAP